MSKISFHQELILNQWMLSFFNGRSILELKHRLGDDRFEGIGEDGHTLFFHELQRNLFSSDLLSISDITRYDLNITKYWNQITQRRNQLEGTALNLKYFQYLSLLFTEIYLDRYFNKKPELIEGLNSQVALFNEAHGIDQQFQGYLDKDLNKLAFWNATGSGKTLLLHANILQYLHYFQRGDIDRFPDKIILLTPNEGLSKQHLEELGLSGFGFSKMFDKNKSPIFRESIEVIDINKLGDEMGEKTVAVEAFEGDNLVLVDEGHRGTGTAAGAWMARREALISNGFAFEYSATFGQAVSKGLTVVKAEEELLKKKARVLFETGNLRRLTNDQKGLLRLSNEERRKARVMAIKEVYAKCILFDYSYKYFYQDGYGKESLILNLKDDDYADADTASQYFTACLLSFYQQQYLWQVNRDKLTEFNIEKPLWIFVGNTVNGEDSDILNVIKFISYFLADEAKAKVWIQELLTNTPRLLDAKGRNIFQNRFTPLMQLSADEIYHGILKLLFNANVRQRLKVVNIKSGKGELALKVGDCEPFGLINIGDDATFFKEVEKPDNLNLFDTEIDEFGPSIFGSINDKNSKINILIGSRKFTEGWSSWRVSTMGLLNMGKGEGSQIIQLFGRGVRLKGRGYSLKRSLPSERPKGAHLERLETLNIFGVNAGYMATFKEYLKEEGITPSDEIIELDFETRINLPSKHLKTLALKDGYKDNQIKGFKRTYYPWLYQIPAEFEGKIKFPHVELDLYPKVEALASKDVSGSMPDSTTRRKGKIEVETMPFFNFDYIYLSLQEFKIQRTWSNLRLDLNMLKDFCLNTNDWYTLFIPETELQLLRFSDVKKQEDILIQLLKEYTDKFYRALKNAYEGQFYDVVSVKEGDESLVKIYHFEIDDNEDGEEYEAKIRALQALVAEKKIGEASKWNAGSMVAICFDRHLYYPLFSFDGDAPLKMRPLSFDVPSEVQFIKDLENFYQSPLGKDIIGDRSLYLLRNADSKAKGLGFALAGNFYPDFLLWLVDDKTGKQWLSFIDPKGIRQMSLSDPKLNLYKEVKVIEEKLGDPNLVLNAFIVSVTKFSDLINTTSTQNELEERNVIFMSDGPDTYLRKMFGKLTA
jgi:hypothetical protein